jgi:hypothetical protein
MDDVREAAPAVVDDGWLRPAAVDGPREPRWGHPDGMQIGLHPLNGPRGLIRVFTPYLGHPRERLLNFVAVEPVPAGQTERGLSELETSGIDGVPGLRFWTADDPADATPRPSDEPSRGRVQIGADGVARLVVHILVEPFANGADVRVTATFRADRPHEVALAAHARESSAPLEACILSATMGNWARLRELRLADGRVATAGELWPEYRDIHFAPHAGFGVGELVRDGDEVVVQAVPDEAAPGGAAYAEGTNAHWHYEGLRAVQEWRVADPDAALRAQVNGRYTYWMSEAPIPGGIAFENFEIVEPFRDGRELTFRVEPL